MFEPFSPLCPTPNDDKRHLVGVRARGSRIGVDSAATCSISIAIWPQVLLVVGGGGGRNGAGRGDLHSIGDATPDPYRDLSCGMHKHCS